jgi:8-oxo-dGTP pyrophosphatase MutT (NUDIX family)
VGAADATTDGIAALFECAWLDDVQLAARYRPFVVDDTNVGWMRPSFVDALAAWPDAFVASADGGLRLAAHLDDEPARTAAIANIVAALAADGVIGGWRDELYAVRSGPDATGGTLFAIERAAARAFGITSEAVHVNGVVDDALGGPRALWIARRATTKAIDPGMLDNLVGGGVAAGLSVRETLVKEAWEEAGFEPALAARATPGRRLRIRRDAAEGLQSEVIHVHDLVVPDGTVPRNVDGEVAAFECMPIDDVVGLIARGDAMTADASLVTLDWLARNGRIALPDTARRRAIFGT